MIKRITALLLALLLVFGLAACGKKGEAKAPKEKFSKDLVTEGKKIALIVTAKDQYPEDYYTAKSLEEKFPDNIVVHECADSRGVNTKLDIISLSEEIAADESINAIVYSRATAYTYNAIQAAKKVNPELHFAAVEPENSDDKVAVECDFVVTADWEKYSKDIVDTAFDMGAEYFVFMSYSRHTSYNPLYAQMSKYLANECEKKKIEYVFNIIEDSLSAGINTAQYSVKQTVVKLYDAHKIEGTKVALFSTDAAVQPTLVSYVGEKNLIYVSPSFPSAYNGICEVYEGKLPDYITDTESYISSVKKSLKDSEASGSYAMYNYSLASTIVRGAVYAMFDVLANDEISPEDIEAAVALRLTDAADNKKFTVDKYLGADNIFECYAPGFEILDLSK